LTNKTTSNKQKRQLKYVKKENHKFNSHLIEDHVVIVGNNLAEDQSSPATPQDKNTTKITRTIYNFGKFKTRQYMQNISKCVCGCLQRAPEGGVVEKGQ
jgi:hypothetical protein